MLTRFVKIQLVLFTILTIVAIVALGWYYLRVPTLLGIGQYTLYAELPRSGGLYDTANVTYRGIQIGKVTAVEPTDDGARAEMSIDSGYKIPIDASANVHSVSAIGEQYLDLVSTGNPDQYYREGQTIADSTVPSEVGPALDAANRALTVLPQDKIDSLLTETSTAVGGLGPALQRLVDSTTNVARGFRDNLPAVNDLIVNSAPILESQTNSRDAIERWSAGLNTLAAQSTAQDEALRGGLEQAAPTADQLNAVFSDVRESLPQTLANLTVVTDMLKRYHRNLEQTLVILPQGGAVAQSVVLPFDTFAKIDFNLGLNQPPACLTGFVPASEWRSPADTTTAPLPKGNYCKIPKDTQANVVRGARNYPCVDVPGKRAATVQECRSGEPYVPLGTDPWYGDPNQIVSCPAPGARCDRGVDPGRVIPAPSINNGRNPLPADQLPGPPSPVSDPLSRPGQGRVTCSGQQPNPCVYTPAPGMTATYSPASGEVVGPDGVRYSVTDSSDLGHDSWKQLLGFAG